MKIYKKQVEDSYQKNAKIYDLAVKILYPLIGLKIGEYRKQAVEQLNLNKDDLVVDLGCGTGLCFPLLMESDLKSGHHPSCLNYLLNYLVLMV